MDSSLERFSCLSFLSAGFFFLLVIVVFLRQGFADMFVPLSQPLELVNTTSVAMNCVELTAVLTLIIFEETEESL